MIYDFSEFLIRTEPGRTDLEQKSPFSPREAYEGTTRGEKGDRIKTIIKMRKTVGFQP